MSTGPESVKHAQHDGESNPAVDSACLDPSTLSAFASEFHRMRVQNQELQAEIEELKAISLRSCVDSSLSASYSAPQPVDCETELVVASTKYAFPTAVQQHERSVWRNRMFCKYLASIGLSAETDVTTVLVTRWSKRDWFGDAERGQQRAKEAGFSSADLANLTVHHIVPRELGGLDSVYNYHLVVKSINSHFGARVTNESMAWVGQEAFHVASRLAQHERRTGSKANFDPFAARCPTNPVKKRRVVVSDTPGKNSTMAMCGAVLEIPAHRMSSMDDCERIVDVTDWGASKANDPVDPMDIPDTTASLPKQTTPAKPALFEYLRHHIHPRADCEKCAVARGTDPSVRSSFASEGGSGHVRDVSKKRACPLADHAISTSDCVPLLDEYERSYGVKVTNKKQKICEFMQTEYGVERLGKAPSYRVSLYSAPRVGASLSLTGGAVKLDLKAHGYEPVTKKGTIDNYMGFYIAR